METKKIIATKALTLLKFLAVFDNKAGWKLDDNGNILLKDGNPIYVKEDGTETTIGAETIGNLNGEAKASRIRAENAEKELTKFKGIDPEKAKEALQKIKDIDQSKLIDAGEVEKVREQVKAEFAGQITELKESNTTLQGNLDGQILDNAFNQSSFVRDAVNVPLDMFRAQFGKNFSIEDGKVVAKGADGNPLYSAERTGELATFDEAIQMIVDRRTDKDAILKAPDKRGSGGGGGGGGRGGDNVMSRSDFDKLSPMEKADAGAKMGKGELTIAD